MPDDSNNPNTRVGAMAPDASTSPVEWGPEIRVNGKRPEWLRDSDQLKLRECGFKFYDDVFSASEVDWHEEVEAIRLPADHPHYRHPNIGYPQANREHSRQPTTPERDPALWDRMEALVRRMALCDATEFGVMGTGCREAYVEASEIALALPKPVDPDLIEAREIAAGLSKPGAYISFSAGERSAELIREGQMDGDALVKALTAAIKRGRELAAPEVSHVG